MRKIDLPLVFEGKGNKNKKSSKGKMFGYQVLGFGSGGSPFSPIVATGGCITTCGNFKIHVFKSPGTFCVSCAGVNAVADYIVQAGGGGGARTGGAGAGGLRFASCTYTAPSCTSPRAGTGLTLSVSPFPITIGCGGAGTPVNPPVPVPSGNKPVKGSNSVFATITSTGGGAGFMPQSGSCGSNTNGGSGGGGVPGGTNPKVACSGIGNSPPVSPPQGFSSTCNPGLPPQATPEGPVTSVDGGGAGGNTSNLASTSAPRTGAAGLGFPTDIMKSCVGVSSPSPTVKFIGGGGGGGSSVNPSTLTTGQHGGGSGGGGTPGNPGSANNGSPGTANTGGGGGGGGAGGGRSTQPPQGGGGSGGSGVVIIRYQYQ